MPARTPKYKLTYPIDSDPIKTLPAILASQANSIETALETFDYAGSDPDHVVAQVNANATRIAALESGRPRYAKYQGGALRQKSGAYLMLTGQTAAHADEAIAYNGTQYTIKTASVVAISATIAFAPFPDPGARVFVDIYQDVAEPTSDAKKIVCRCGTSEGIHTISYTGHFNEGTTLLLGMYYFPIKPVKLNSAVTSLTVWPD